VKKWKEKNALLRLARDFSILLIQDPLSRACQCADLICLKSKLYKQAAILPISLSNISPLLYLQLEII